MKMMMMYFILISLITIMITIMILFISKKTMSNMQKTTPFECGFNPMSYSRLPFSIHFFMIAVIFLIFDIEIIIVMPMIMTIKSSQIKYWLTTCFMFTSILIVGLYHEWINGMIQWTN